MADPPKWLLYPFVKTGAWVAYDDSVGTYLGTIARIPCYNAIHLRVVSPRDERVICCGLSRGRVRPMSVLEVMAVVSQDFFFERPDIRLCENEDCTNIIDPMKGLYCSTPCAVADA